MKQIVTSTHLKFEELVTFKLLQFWEHIDNLSVLQSALIISNILVC